MTQASSTNPDSDRLSPNARRMLALRDEVLSEWGERLRETVQEAEHLSHPVLINTLPVLYQHIVEAIAPDFPRTALSNSTVASEHGGERARLTNYNVQSLVTEYQLLRWTIFDVLKLNGVRLDMDEFTIVNACIDGSIRESVTAFALAESALRERFVATLTHDLRNPLAAAYASAELISRITDVSKVKELAARITANLGRMDAMIRELLDAAVFHAGERLTLHMENMDILVLAKEVGDQFEAIHGPRFALLGVSVPGFWDRNALKRAIENLVGNAVKYGAPGSVITLKIDATHGRMIFSVHNTGAPMPPEEIESVFKVFERAVAAKEGDQQGWGIGLPYVRSVAESHGGSVAAESAMATGTTFVIDIPIDARPFQNVPTLGSGGQ
jgi:signal transduction histidine kinase